VDPRNLVYVLALLVGAAVVVIVLLRVMKARGRAAEKAPAPPATPGPTAGEDEYLDSSHILGGTDAAARAAEALRRAKDKRK
jgi:hypothetical protein